jgi:hypothetical protein
MLAALLPAFAASQETQSPELAGDSFTASPNLPSANATVQLNNRWYGTACTGVLVAPDIVLTAGHCIMGMFPPGRACDACAVANGRTCIACNPGNPVCPGSPPVPANCITNDVSRFDGAWHRFPASAGALPVNVNYGPITGSPIVTRSAIWFSSPPWVGHPFIGHQDIGLLGLTGGSVAKTVALPRAIHYSKPAGLTSSSRIGVVGFTILQRRRMQGLASSPTDFANHTLGALLTGAGDVFESGDSGSPVFYPGLSGNVLGITPQGDFGSLVAVKAWFAGNATLASTTAWLQARTQMSLCAAVSPVTSSDDAASHRKLMNWWSPSREDNFTTATQAWNGCYPGFDKRMAPDYGYARLEGWLPLNRSSTTMVALNLYYNPASNDNATATADFRPPTSWVLVERLGWVWPMPALGRLPLKLWYSASRGDYFTTTTSTDWSTSGYVLRGTLGYVPAPKSFAQLRP